MSKSRITIVGTGFIGGSLGLALKKAKVEAEIVGHDKDNSAAHRALKRGAVDTTKWNLLDACDGAGLIILALPLAGIQPTLAALKKELPAGVVITDTAATKAPVMEWALDLPENVSFIGGNPILKPTRAVGASIDAADADAFQGATYCLVASPHAAPGAIDVAANLAGLIGAQPYFVDAHEHDGIMAGVQHFPALVASALAASAMLTRSWRESGKLAGAEFRDATTLVPADGKTAAADFLAHRADLLQWLDVFNRRLADLRALIERSDAAGIDALIEQIAIERVKWLGGKMDATSPAVDWKDVQFSPQRLFLGNLGERAKKP